MRTHVDFRSEKFPRYPGEVEGVNHETIWGKRLAEYLAARLKERGFPVEEPFAEDWGWMVPIRNAAFPLWIGCANYGEERDHGARHDCEHGVQRMPGLGQHGRFRECARGIAGCR